MKAFLSLSSVAAALLLLVPAWGLADDSKAKQDAIAGDKPGPIHKDLARLAGEYDTVSKFWMKPGGEPKESKGTAKITPMIDGRFLFEEFTGMEFGQPIKGWRLTGYNNLTSQFEATWGYSMATGMMSMTGTSKDDGKTIEWIATYMNNQHGKETLYVTTRRLDDDHFVVELVAKNPNGEKGPTLETTYSRRK